MGEGSCLVGARSLGEADQIDFALGFIPVAVIFGKYLSVESDKLRLDVLKSYFLSHMIASRN